MNEFEFIAYAITFALGAAVVGSAVWLRFKVILRHVGEALILLSDVADDNMITGAELKLVKDKVFVLIEDALSIKKLLGLK